MEPLTLSATAVETFEGCAARFNATNVAKTPDVQGERGAMGSACHEALEKFVLNRYYEKPPGTAIMKDLLDDAYYNWLSEPTYFKECLEMLEHWYNRQVWGDWTAGNREVVSCETKETFDLPFAANNPNAPAIIPFSYIFDRLDRWTNEAGDLCVEVIDYKTFVQPLQPQDLKNKIQARAYALAVQILFPDAKEVWVSFDLLRYDLVGCRFSREENIATWEYLQNVASRIFDDEGKTETLNANCRYCVRRFNCNSYLRNRDTGGIMAMNDVNVAIDTYARLDAISKAARDDMDILKDQIIDQLAEMGIMGTYKTEHTQVELKARNSEEIDTERVIAIVGPDIAARYGMKLNVTSVDQMIKDEGVLTSEQKSAVKQLFRKKRGALYPKVRSLTELDDED